MTLSTIFTKTTIIMIIGLIIIPFIMKYLFKQESIKTNALNLYKKCYFISVINILVEILALVLFLIYYNAIFFIIYLIFSNLDFELTKLREQKTT